MSYTHTFVSDIVEEASLSVEGEVAECPSTVMVDGIPMLEGLATFCTTLRKQPAFRNIKFGLRKSNIMRRHNIVYAYYPHDIYVLGRVGYGDFSYSGSTEYKFIVESPNITNHKYGWHRDNYNRVMSKDVGKAVTNAKKFLRQYSAVALADVSVGEFTSSFYYEVDQRQRSVREAIRNIANDINEAGSVTLQLLIDVVSGNKPDIPEHVTNLVASYTEAKQSFKEEAAEQFRVALVYTVGEDQFRMIMSTGAISEDSVGMHYNLAGDLRDVIHSENSSLTTGQVLTSDTLPEEVAGKLALLGMVDKGVYVSKVGYKFNERVCYVMVTV